jgi:hypothetical protein
MSNIFSANHAVYGVRWEYMVEPETTQYGAAKMRSECRIITKGGTRARTHHARNRARAHTHTQYPIRIASQLFKFRRTP